MGKKEVNKELLDLGFTSENYNTNNADGFDGSFGTKYTKDNININIGTRCQCTKPQIKFITVYKASEVICDYIAYSYYYNKMLDIVKQLIKEQV